jgi:hypothetical protein
MNKEISKQEYFIKQAMLVTSPPKISDDGSYTEQSLRDYANRCLQIAQAISNVTSR